MANCGSRTGLLSSSEVAAIDDPQDAGLEEDAAVVFPNDAPDEPKACIAGKFTFTLAIPQLMFVLDRSGSMSFALNSNEAPPQGSPSRWAALRDSLSLTIAPFSNEIAMGARFFPAANADPFDSVRACQQDPPSSAIVPALGSAGSILNVFDTTVPVGGTPTALALNQATSDMSSSRSISRAIVLATDGAPNCNPVINQATCTCTTIPTTFCQAAKDGSSCLDDDRTIKTISDTFELQKIPVYIVGIGVTGSFASTLDAMAVAGGRPRTGSPKYFAADTPSELTDAFNLIRNGVARCSYITPSSPEDPNAIVVELSGKPLPRDTTHQYGWDWVDQAYGHLKLYGAACDQATTANVSGTIKCKNK